MSFSLWMARPPFIDVDQRFSIELVDGLTITMGVGCEERIIGGMFGLEAPKEIQSAAPHFLTASNLFLVNARSGIALLVDLLSPANVWLPSYLCGSIVDAINRSKAVIKFYEVNYDLEIAS